MGCESFLLHLLVRLTYSVRSLVTVSLPADLWEVLPAACYLVLCYECDAVLQTCRKLVITEAEATRSEERAETAEQ